MVDGLQNGYLLGFYGRLRNGTRFGKVGGILIALLENKQDIKKEDFLV